MKSIENPVILGIIKKNTSLDVQRSYLARLWFQAVSTWIARLTCFSWNLPVSTKNCPAWPQPFLQVMYQIDMIGNHQTWLAPRVPSFHFDFIRLNCWKYNEGKCQRWPQQPTVFPMLISQQARKVNPHRLNRPQQQNLPIATEVFLVKTDYAPIITNLENMKWQEILICARLRVFAPVCWVFAPVLRVKLPGVFLVLKLFGPVWCPSIHLCSWLTEVVGPNRIRSLYIYTGTPSNLFFMVVSIGWFPIFA